MNLDTQNLPPEVAAYIRSLEQKNQQLEKQLVKMQSLNEQLVKMRKRMFGQSSEQIQYVDARQLDFFNEAEVCRLLQAQMISNLPSPISGALFFSCTGDYGAVTIRIPESSALSLKSTS